MDYTKSKLDEIDPMTRKIDDFIFRLADKLIIYVNYCKFEKLYYVNKQLFKILTSWWVQS